MADTQMQQGGNVGVFRITDSELYEAWMTFAHFVVTYSNLNANYSTPQHIVCEDGLQFVMRQPMDDVVLFALVGPSSLESKYYVVLYVKSCHFGVIKIVICVW